MLVEYTREENEYVPYDVTMFWEFFRWERYNRGHIYLQRFPHGKMYAGQTIQLSGRMSQYRRGVGSNPHHSHAIKKYYWSNVNVLTIECPWYMLDTIEIFLIEYYDLTDSKKGYNKQTGGRQKYMQSKDTRAKISAALVGKKHKPEHVAKTTGEKNGMFSQGYLISGEKHGMYGKFGPEHNRFGKKKTSEQIASGEKHGMYGKFGPEHPAFGYKKKPEQIASSGKHGKSKPVCVFGKVYPSANDASRDLRAEYAPKNKEGNFVAGWINIPKHQSYTFRVSKDFYAYVTENNLENITRNLYDTWLLRGVQSFIPTFCISTDM